MVHETAISLASEQPARLSPCLLIAYKKASRNDVQEVGLTTEVTTKCKMNFEGAFGTMNKISLFAPDDPIHNPVPGMSGGPILNEGGNVIGSFYSVRPARYPKQSYSWDMFAINSKHILDTIKYLLQH